MSDVLTRFMRYVQVSTQSNEDNCDVTPSTPCQFDLANMLAQELLELGAADAHVTDNAYVVAHVPATPGHEDAPALGLIAHIDTTQDAPADNVCPRVITYEGGDLVAGVVDGKPVSMSAEKLPALHDLVGQELVVTDGTTLLGGDDKAGVAEIMSMIVYLNEHPQIAHPTLGICFAPDEEIGHGAELLDIEEFNCKYAFTVDGGPIGELEWECFNAAGVTMEFSGHTIHPGDAKGRMVNAIHLFEEFQACLPAHMRPEHTEGYEGFIHILSFSGTCEHATARYIVRDHDAAAFERKLDLMQTACKMVNARHNSEVAHIEIVQQYQNMAEIVKDELHLIDNAKIAFEKAGYTPTVIPIRGGTDGAQLSFRGLPCPNLSTGGYCMHSVNEFIPVKSLEDMVNVLVELVALYA